MASYGQETFWDRIKSRQGHLERRREKYDDQRNVICELFRPDLVKGLLDTLEEGKFEGEQIIEGTGPYSALVWQRGFQGNIVSRKSTWFRHRMEESKFKGNDEVNNYLQDFDDHFTSVYKRSNYYDIMPEYVLSGGTIGSPVFLREEDPVNGNIICKIPHYSQVYLDKDIFGRDNVLHIKQKLSALHAFEYFVEKDLPATVKTQLETGNYYDETDYIQAIYGAGDRIFDDLTVGEKPQVTHPWMEFFICTTGVSSADKKILKPKNKGPGYFYRPFSAWHYWRNWHEIYARTPAWWAIFDVRGNNKLWEALFGEADISLQPPIWAMGSMQGMLDLGPAGANYARTLQEYGQPPQFLERKTRYDIAIEFADRLKAAIERHFHVQLFMMAQQAELRHEQPITAYQIFRMEAERHGQLAPSVERYEGDVLTDNDNAFIDIEQRAGRLPEPPEILLRESSGEVVPEFIGPLSLAQVRDVTLTRIQNNLGGIEPILNFWPETKYKIKASELIEQVLEEGDFPQSKIVPEEEYQEIIAAMNQRQAQMEMLEMAPKAATAVKALQGKTEKESPLALMAGAAA